MDEFEAVGVEITHGYCKRTYIPEGVTLVQHSHKADHMSALVAGRAEVKVEGSKAMTYVAPTEIMIPAHYKHSVLALTPVIWYCVHDMDDLVALGIDERLIE